MRSGRVELRIWVQLVELVANEEADWLLALELEHATEDAFRVVGVES
jgi:hypothetical protein